MISPTRLRASGSTPLASVSIVVTALLISSLPLQALTAASGASASGDESGNGGLITARRSLAVAFLAGSVALTLKGFDFRDEADQFYDAYKAATDEAEIQRFYQRTTNRDVKSQVSWALAAAFGVTGLRLLFTGDLDSRPALRGPHGVAPARPHPSLVPDVTPKILGLRLQRHFY